MRSPSEREGDRKAVMVIKKEEKGNQVGGKIGGKKLEIGRQEKEYSEEMIRGKRGNRKRMMSIFQEQNECESSK